jgi:hypothetical protein
MHKTLKDPLHQWLWLSRTPVDHRPQLGVLTDTGYSYEWLEGDPPSVMTAIGTARAVLWKGPASAISRVAYVNYCLDLPDVRKCMVPIILRLYHLPLTPACRVHGDLTLSNMIGNRFIDPGYDRGLVCEELDIAKICQSIDGWDAIRWNHKRPTTQITRNESINVILMTHYLRLLRHDHPHEALTFARERLEALCQELQ